MPETEILFIVEEADGGYMAHAAGHDIFTQSETLDELRAMVRDAVLAHFDEDERPPVIRLHIVRDELLPV